MTGGSNATAVKVSRVPTAGMPGAIVSQLFLDADGRTQKTKPSYCTNAKPGDESFLSYLIEQARTRVFQRHLTMCRMKESRLHTHPGLLIMLKAIEISGNKSPASQPLGPVARHRMLEILLISIT